MGQQHQAECIHGVIPQSPQSKTSLLARTAACASLYSSTCVCFESWRLNALEGSFALNLIILVGATYYIKISGGNQMAAGYTSISMTLATFMGILAFQLANVTGIAQYLKTKFPAIAVTNVHQTEVESSLPDRLINPREYEPPLHTPHQHSISEPTEGKLVTEAKKRLTPVYTYGSIN